MALTPEHSAEVETAMSKLRAMGCAVCIFMPDDVESSAEGMDMEISPHQAADWLMDNRRRLEDHLSERGNSYIDDNLAIPVS